MNAAVTTVAPAQDLSPMQDARRGFPAHEQVMPLRWRSQPSRACRDVPAETAVAIVANGTSHAVMMATPDDLEDFAVGFALTEGLITRLDQVEEIEVVAHPRGLEARLWLQEGRARALASRRRQMAGPTGCGMCGLESLDEALREVPRVEAECELRPADVVRAMAALGGQQHLHARTRAVHAAAFWTPRGGILALREDVGRHNALDKLVGALARQGVQDRYGLLLLTSRVSLEMVQKAAIGGFPMLAAVSAPTASALEAGASAGMTVIGVTRDDGFEIFTHPRRITGATVPISA
ncbi:formate dehydrogenase accessory sulfurtransferase FdhD [Plastorhodobacter daqingensis]|uniref:Sulfur carrier protein FdhD n=1 Tax=Plastorhodobacter daqingensis TaxID=1387281 RepID=A0ABW2UM51_9RHOB